jgi:hypothetical protein
MWIVLSFTACLVSSPAQCEPRELAYSADYLTVTQCQSQGVFMLAQWAVQHPRWQVSGSYRCSTTRAREVET